MSGRRFALRRRPEWVQQLEPRRLLANLGDVGLYLVDHATQQRVTNPAAGTQVEIHATFTADSLTPGTVVRVQRDTENGALYTEVSSPSAWTKPTPVDRNLFTWTIPPTNAWVTITLDPRNSIEESDESDNTTTLTLTPPPSPTPPTPPAYHSLPSAHYAIYLDFDGHYQTNFAGSHDVTTPVFDTDGNPSLFSPAEQDEIRQIWARVSEDYAPFNIDVTTELPSDAQYTRWQRIAIGGASADWYQFSAAGTAIVRTFTDATGGAAFVFTQQDNGDGSTFQYSVPTIADAASHEAGHTFGLMHQASYDPDGNLVSSYNLGSGSWGAIMGQSGKPVSTWYNGPTDESPTTYQDDMAIIASPENGFGYRPDDAGNDPSSATPLGPLTGALSTSGIIGANDDIDVYSITLPAGRYHFAADVPLDGPNLDAILNVYDPSGTLLTTANPPDTQSASLDLTLPAGTYSIAVQSTGLYGWIGQYTLSIQDLNSPIPPASPAPVPTPGLTIAIKSKPPKSVKAGSKGTTTVTIGNAGEIASKTTMTIKLYATPSDPSSTNILLATLKSTLPTGKNKLFRIPLTYPKSMPAGTYSLLATLESSNGTTQASTTNPTPIQLIVPAAKLTATLSPKKRTLPTQQPWTTTITIKNTGTAPFSGTALIQLYASIDDTLGNEDDTLLVTTSLNTPLRPGKSKTITLQAQPQESSGTRYLFATATPSTGTPTSTRKGVKIRFLPTNTPSLP